MKSSVKKSCRSSNCCDAVKTREIKFTQITTHQNSNRKLKSTIANCDLELKGFDEYSREIGMNIFKL